jgi:hypothetical protein
LQLIESRPDDAAVYSDPLLANNAPEMLELFDDLKTRSGNDSSEPVMRKLRSEKMLAALQNDLAGAARTIYKLETTT